MDEKERKRGGGSGWSVSLRGSESRANVLTDRNASRGQGSRATFRHLLQLSSNMSSHTATTAFLGHSCAGSRGDGWRIIQKVVRGKRGQKFGMDQKKKTKKNEQNNLVLQMTGTPTVGGRQCKQTLVSFSRTYKPVVRGSVLQPTDTPR